MKIYQLHKYGGEWEDVYDHIIGSYLRKERAEELMADFKQRSKIREEESRHCMDCPVWEQLGDNIEQIAQKCADYCSRFVRDNQDDGGFECNNWQSYWELPGYRIEEVEVEE